MLLSGGAGCALIVWGAIVDDAADAIALGRPAGFARHAVWLAGFLASSGVPRAQLVAQLEALAAAAPAIVPGHAAGELAITIATALAAASG